VSGALSEALVAAQRRAVAVLEKVYVSDSMDEEQFRTTLDAPADA